jgi:hypothetical protein
MKYTFIVTIIIVVVCIAAVCVGLYKIFHKSLQFHPDVGGAYHKVLPDEGFTLPLVKNKVHEPKTFFIYNYCLVPIDVVVNDVDIVSGIPPKGKKGITQSMVDQHFKEGALVQIYAMSTTSDNTDNPKGLSLSLILQSLLTIPPNTTIKALHCGQNMGSMDIALISDPVKSPLGTALSRLRIVNTTPKTLRLTTTGNNTLIIPSGKSLLYLGRWDNGIPLGTTISDRDGILPTYIVNVPMTDLFIGIVSDIPLPLYNDITPFGLAFTDTPGIPGPDNALEIHNMQRHAGRFIDNSYVPANW